MEFITTPIHISSSDRERGSTHDFVVFINPPIDVSPETSFIALSSVEMTYSWFNVTSSYGNNIIEYSHDSGSTWTQISFSDGNYGYKTLSNYIKSSLQANSHSVSGISISFIPTRLLCYIKLESTYQVRFPSTSSFNELIGFANGITVVTSSYGTLLPNITRSVDAIYWNCDIISDGISSNLNNTNAIFQVQTESLPLSYPFSRTPLRLLPYKVNTSKISYIRFYLHDQLGRSVNLNNTEVTFELLLRY